MGEYGIYIWPSYIVVALAMIGILLISLHSRRVRQRQLSNLQKEDNAQRMSNIPTDHRKDDDDS